jgi:ATP-dependent Clp protease protease subunit
LMAAETWLSAEEAVALGLADRVEAPVRMAAHFNLSRFRNAPPQLAALATNVTAQEDDMPDTQKKRLGRSARAEAAEDHQAPTDGDATDVEAAASEAATALETQPEQPAAADRAREATRESSAAPEAEADNGSTKPAPQPTAQVIDLDAVRADERRATLAYVAEVHDLCALASRGDLAAGFIEGDAGRPDPSGPARGTRR